MTIAEVTTDTEQGRLRAFQARAVGIEAVAAAKTRFGLSDDQIDKSTGAVRGVVSLRGDSRHQGIRAWIVVADVDVPGFGPNTRKLVYHKVCIVIDAVSGKFKFAYATDPS